MGIAIARYDYSARDMRELSLMEGDVVKIYNKMGANGWWKGEVNSRVSAKGTQRALDCQCQHVCRVVEATLRLTDLRQEWAKGICWPFAFN